MIIQNQIMKYMNNVNEPQDMKLLGMFQLLEIPHLRFNYND